jgi:EspG family
MTLGRVTPDWSRATVLPATEFEACWDVLQLGETPWQLDPPRYGSTATARQAFVAEVLARLRASGPDLAEKLRLLAHPSWAVDVRLRAKELVAGLAACRGADGVLAVRHGDEMALVDIPAAEAVAAVLSLLGPVRPGPCRPTLITVGRDAVHASLQAALRDVRMFGQLGASVAAHDGCRVRRAPRVIGFHRTDVGDYRSVRVDRCTIALEPATPERLAADLDGLLALECERYNGFAGRGST